MDGIKGNADCSTVVGSGEHSGNNNRLLSTLLIVQTLGDQVLSRISINRINSDIVNAQINTTIPKSPCNGNAFYFYSH